MLSDRLEQRSLSRPALTRKADCGSIMRDFAAFVSLSSKGQAAGLLSGQARFPTRGRAGCGLACLGGSGL